MYIYICYCDCPSISNVCFMRLQLCPEKSGFHKPQQEDFFYPALLVELVAVNSPKFEHDQTLDTNTNQINL